MFLFLRAPPAMTFAVAASRVAATHDEGQCGSLGPSAAFLVAALGPDFVLERLPRDLARATITCIFEEVTCPLLDVSMAVAHGRQRSASSGPRRAPLYSVPAALAFCLD
jgi:hypothetical protein